MRSVEQRVFSRYLQEITKALRGLEPAKKQDEA
jgi:hypothetical protein